MESEVSTQNDAANGEGFGDQHGERCDSLRSLAHSARFLRLCSPLRDGGSVWRCRSTVSSSPVRIDGSGLSVPNQVSTCSFNTRGPGMR